MAITAATVTAALKIGLGDQERYVDAEVERVIGVADALITKYLGDDYDDVPQSILDEAGVRLCGWFLQTPGGEPTGYATKNPIRNSGASAVLAPWRTVGLGIVEAEED